MLLPNPHSIADLTAPGRTKGIAYVAARKIFETHAAKQGKRILNIANVDRIVDRVLRSHEGETIYKKYAKRACKHDASIIDEYYGHVKEKLTKQFRHLAN